MAFPARTLLGALLTVWGAGSALAGEAPKASTQFGTQRLDFAVGGGKGFILLPTQPAPDGSKPWVWYAPTFIGMHPDPSHGWMFKQLLASGFAIGGVDVGESYGSPKGRAIYTEFHKLVVAKYGLSPKACLLPQSRGGLMLYTWAAEHPDCVACIGGIYTVCDLASYPGLARACGAYGLAEAELKAHLPEHNPIDRLAPLAAAKVPILHLHGDADAVVPLERNSGELARRYRALGGPVELLVVKGKGHQVCPEFFQSQRLVDFFLTRGPARRQAGGRLEPPIRVTPLPEYDSLFRRESGWTGADVAASAALSDDVTLWLYGDTWVGDIRDGKHANATMVSNSVALQRGRDPAKASVEFFWGQGKDGKPAALIAPADGRGFYWLMNCVRTPKGLFLFAAQVERAGKQDDAFGFRHLATWLLEVANPAGRPPAWRVTHQKVPAGRFSPQGDTAFGAALLRHGGFVYVYGYSDDVVNRFRARHAIVARAPDGGLADFGQWRFYGDEGWQPDWTKATRLFSQAASEYSVSHQPERGQFVAIYVRDGISGRIEMRRAPAPEGPWGAPAAVYECPEMKWDKSLFCYAAKAHPELATAANELILTYVANSTSFWHMAGDARLYWPRFLRVRF